MTNLALKILLILAFTLAFIIVGILLRFSGLEVLGGFVIVFAMFSGLGLIDQD